nr:histidine phosphatase family protein [Marivita sp. S6314]
MRHGQTVWNAERRIQGQFESDLTDTGIGHARTQARLLQPILPVAEAFHVSPLRRAQQTARIALGDLPYTVDPRLAEAHAGDWQGLLRDDVLRQWPERTRPDMSALELFLSAPGGERLDAFRGRITAFLSELSAPSVIVAHGLWGQAMRAHVLGLGWDDMLSLSNDQACVYVLEDGQETVLRAA